MNREPPPIDGRFVSLGRYRFEKDGAGYVLISNEGTTGYVTVDALQLLAEEEIDATLLKDDTSDNEARRAPRRSA